MFPTLVLTLLYCGRVSSFPTFASLIPNGDSVPNPGPQGGTWAGVGHIKTGGGGDLNKFGLDFVEQGFVWSEELCLADSDGDGRSNGEELGDPNCTWQVGGSDPTLPALSHPGIPDKALDKPATNPCDGYVEPSVKLEYDISFTQKTSIDKTRTHYICEQFEKPVPSPEVLHKIKDSILLDNSSVLHHMFIFLCPNGSTDGNRVGQGPYVCGGNESVCLRIAGWAVGNQDTCLPPNIGEELDFTGMQNIVVKVEAHYDNTSGGPQQDQSGIQVTFTPELRPIRASGTVLGMLPVDKNFELPAEQASYELTNICPSDATATLPHPIFVYSFTPHMHLLGRTLVTEHYRCGEKIGELGRINSYEFDNQQTYLFDKPIKILPGDALLTTCTFDTTSANETTYGGEETTDEMCLNFLGFYPFVETKTLGICFTVTDGFDMDRFDGNIVSGGGLGEGEGGIPQDRSSLLENLSFALVKRPPSPDSFLFQYESDPSKSWATCCDAGTCNITQALDVGGTCATDQDCIGSISCDGGLCTNLISDSSGSTSPTVTPKEVPTVATMETNPVAVPVEINSNAPASSAEVISVNQPTASDVGAALEDDSESGTTVLISVYKITAVAGLLFGFW